MPARRTFRNSLKKYGHDRLGRSATGFNVSKTKGGKMYSPKIRDYLISLIYRLARQEGKPMTRLVDEILRGELERRLRVAGEQSNPDPFGSLKKTPGER
jgi:hypothetical protein